MQYRINGEGGYEQTLSLCGWFIEKQLGQYGDAVSDIWVTAFMSPHEPPSAMLESVREMYMEHLPTLPKCRFYRKKRSIEIDAITDFVRPPFRSRHLDRTYLISPELFRFGLREIVRIISQVSDRFTARDNFETAAFLRDLAECVHNAPETQQQIDDLRQEQFRKFEEDAKNADPWQRLGIDWDEYHRNSRKLLNDPFYWEQSNDLAPNGNDTGADVLSEYIDWRIDNKPADPLKWLESLLSAWGVDLSLSSGQTTNDVGAMLEKDEFSVSTWDDAAIGLAFACLKVDGKLPAPIATLALRAIERQSLDTVITHRGWRDTNERKQWLKRAASVLQPYREQTPI